MPEWLDLTWRILASLGGLAVATFFIALLGDLACAPRSEGQRLLPGPDRDPNQSPEDW